MVELVNPTMALGTDFALPMLLNTKGSNQYYQDLSVITVIIVLGQSSSITYCDTGKRHKKLQTEKEASQTQGTINQEGFTSLPY